MPELLSGTGNVDDALRDLYTLRGAATTDAIAADPFAAGDAPGSIRIVPLPAP